MGELTIPSGKIAFMFPAKFNLEGARSPVLNFSVRDDGIIAMSVGISFLELNAGSPYFVNLKLSSPNGDEVTISSTLEAIPGDHIDPIKRSSFLTASYYFEPSLNGSHRFTCELLDVIRDSKPVDAMSLWFNVLGVEDSSAS
ncbi:hypothetical protein [Pantoea stewartii]|uniref:Uncharacterized protein n=1 Tax=Pantoea stewartii subsp. stewartii DC283 TaxID=660596 RepID=A0ABN4YY75_PANSE|nr:hypothetical protein [Pantoea stewartii]ARF49687.1 hypothetical protein DSJ_10270 [Pantoea stewartii subsp. stewartii DC283]KAB0551402.1 hypothetical protein F7Q90_18140 [Pantoea stewartii subsp. stewartii]